MAKAKVKTASEDKSLQEILEEEKKRELKKLNIGQRNIGTVSSLKKLEETEDGRETIANVVSNALYMFEVGKDRVKTDEELENRISWYFATCVDCRIIPTVEGLANSLGYDRRTVWDWETNRRGGLGPRTADILKKAKSLLSQIDAELTLDGKINTLLYFFRSKNYYGMVDKVEHVVTPNNAIDFESDKAVLEAKYDELPD